MRWPLPDAYPRLYVQFLYYFNVIRDHYECHEVLEELWFEEGRNPFYQGLLQVAVALYHFRNDNRGGAIKLFRSALDKLDDFPKDSLGIDLEKVRDDTKDYLERLEQYDAHPFDFYDLHIHIQDPELQQLVEKEGKLMRLNRRDRRSTIRQDCKVDGSGRERDRDLRDRKETGRGDSSC